MSKFTPLTDELHAYAVEHGAREDELLRRLREETDEVAGDLAVMQIAPDQGALMALLVRAIGARRALELGTFTGYSAICIARALPGDGVLVACDVSEEWTRSRAATSSRPGSRIASTCGSRRRPRRWRRCRATTPSTSPSSMPTRRVIRATGRSACGWCGRVG